MGDIFKNKTLVMMAKEVNLGIEKTPFEIFKQQVIDHYGKDKIDMELLNGLEDYINRHIYVLEEEVINGTSDIKPKGIFSLEEE